MHADTAVHGHDRQGLERLARYGARGPVAESRLRRLDDGRYEYSPKKGSAFTLTASALVRRLVALLPPARLHLTSFHGALGSVAGLGADQAWRRGWRVDDEEWTGRAAGKRAERIGGSRKRRCCTRW